MPSHSPKQKRTMAAIAHGWKPPAGSDVADIPVKVAKEFNAADKRRDDIKKVIRKVRSK